MDRYQNIVRVSFYGHTHQEEFSVTKSVREGKNIGMNFITGSLTTFTNKDPSFSVMALDQDLLIPLTHQTYSLNLNKTNQNNTPVWTLLHDYASMYNLEDLSPDSFNHFSQQVKSDVNLSLLYKWNKVKQTAHRKPTTCDAKCR